METQSRIAALTASLSVRAPAIAATSAALLPKVPHEVQEGWIRVAPAKPDRGRRP